MEKLVAMLQLQQRLNDATNGKGWEHGKTNRGKIIDWRRCGVLECAELIESYPWKHWKSIDAEPDVENIKIEAVDIWHFILSLVLQENTLHGKGDIRSAAARLTDARNFDAFKKGIAAPQDYYAQIETVETLMRRLLCDGTVQAVVEAFYDVALQSNLTLESLYKLYIGKNILNSFRQDHGYKEGNYIKVWNGEEDNVVMQRLLEEQPDITPDALYNALEAHYPG